MKLFTVIFIFIFLSVGFGQQKDNAAQKNNRTVQKREKIIDYSKKYKNQWLLYFEGVLFRHLYNPTMAKRKGQIIEIWTRKIDITDDEVVALTLYEIDCASRKLRYTANTAYYTYDIQPDGGEFRKKINAGQVDNIDEPFEDIFRDTAPAALVNITCRL